MRKLLITILLCLSMVAAVRFPSPVEKGCVVPFQTMFMTVNPTRWVDRAAQAWCESGFNPKAVSPVGARGLTQFMPATWKSVMPPTADPFNPSDAIIAQNKYMNQLEAMCRNNNKAALGVKFEEEDIENAALGSYNAGFGNIRKAQRLAKSLGLEGRDAWMRVYPQVQKNPAFVKETLGYITRHDEKTQQINKMLEQQKKP